MDKIKNLPCRHCGENATDEGSMVRHPENGCYYSGWEMKYRMWTDCCAPSNNPNSSQGVDLDDLFNCLFQADKDFKAASDHSEEEEEAYERRNALRRKIEETIAARPTPPPAGAGELREAVEAAEAWLRTTWFELDSLNDESSALAHRLQAALPGSPQPPTVKQSLTVQPPDQPSEGDYTEAIEILSEIAGRIETSKRTGSTDYFHGRLIPEIRGVISILGNAEAPKDSPRVDGSCSSCGVVGTQKEMGDPSYHQPGCYFMAPAPSPRKARKCWALFGPMGRPVKVAQDQPNTNEAIGWEWAPMVEADHG